MSSLSPDPLQWGLGKLSTLAASFTAPVTDVVNYIYPPIKAYFSNLQEIQSGACYPIARMMKVEVIRSIQVEAKKLVECAGIHDQMKIYTNAGAPYDGTKSTLGSILVIPLQDVHERVFSETISQEHILNGKEIETRKNSFTDNEVRFQLARGIIHMDHSLMKAVVRIMIAAFSISLLFTPIGWIGGIFVFAASIVLYCAVHRYVEEKADRRAIEVLAKRLEQLGCSKPAALRNATIVAINCLKKLQAIIIAQRNESRFCRLFYDSSGNSWVDLSSPNISRRIKKLEKNLLSSIRHRLMPSKKLSKQIAC